MNNIGTPHPVVGVLNAIVSEDDHHSMIQLSDDSSEDPTPFPFDYDELATPSTDRSYEKAVPAPQHVQSSVMTTPNIQTQAFGRSPTVLCVTTPGTLNKSANYEHWITYFVRYGSGTIYTCISYNYTIR